MILDGVILLLLLAAAAYGVLQGVRLHTHPHGDNGSGWLYFISNGKGSPIKVGMSRYEPSGDRLHALRTMSPTPLRVLYSIPVRDRFAAEHMAHEQLAPYRMHGEWFERDPTLALIEHLKGNY